MLPRCRWLRTLSIHKSTLRVHHLCPSRNERTCNGFDGCLSRCVAIVTGTVIHTQAPATLFQPVPKH